MSKKIDTLSLMSAMNQQQSQQFMAATLLAIAITMKKHGITELEISPNDYMLLEQGESLEPIPTVDGGMIYKFVKVTPPLAKRVTPDFVKQPAAPAKKDAPGKWISADKAKAQGWYTARAKGSKVETLVRLDETGVFVDEQGTAVAKPFQVKASKFVVGASA